MFDTEQHPTLIPRVRTLQLVVAALAMGALIFLGIVALGPVDEPTLGDAAPILTYVALAYGLVAPPAGPLLSNRCHNDDPAQAPEEGLPWKAGRSRRHGGR